MLKTQKSENPKKRAKDQVHAGVFALADLYPALRATFPHEMGKGYNCKIPRPQYMNKCAENQGEKRWKIRN